MELASHLHHGPGDLLEERSDVQRLIQGDALAAWCVRWLGAQPTRVLFEVVHLSRVTGLQLADGREVVIKARPPANRIQACVHVQRHLWAAGSPCPEPLAGPHPLGTLTATAETFVPGGTRLDRGQTLRGCLLKRWPHLSTSRPLLLLSLPSPRRPHGSSGTRPAGHLAPPR